MRRYHSLGQVFFLFLLLHLSNKVKYLFQLLRLLFHVSGQNGQEILVLLVSQYKLFFQCVTDHIDFALWRLALLGAELGSHQKFVFFLNQLLGRGGLHELKFYTSLCVYESIYEQI